MVAVFALICKSKQVLSAPTIKILSIIDVSTVSIIQWLPLENYQVLFYEAKVPFSERCIAVRKCHYAIEHLRHSYHTLALSKKVYNFVFTQGTQNLSAIKI